MWGFRLVLKMHAYRFTVVVVVSPPPPKPSSTMISTGSPATPPTTPLIAPQAAAPAPSLGTTLPREYIFYELFFDFSFAAIAVNTVSFWLRYCAARRLCFIKEIENHAYHRICTTR